MKTAKQIKVKAPLWERRLTQSAIQKAVEDYGGPLAKDIDELSGMIGEVDGLFLACSDPNIAGDLPDEGNPIQISNNNVRLLSKGQGDYITNGDLVMQQSETTYRPVMRLLYSAVCLRDDIEEISSPEQAQKFYEDLKKDMRFYWGQLHGDEYSSGLATFNTKPRTAYKYMGHYRIDTEKPDANGLNTKGLIKQLSDWQNTPKPEYHPPEEHLAVLDFLVNEKPMPITGKKIRGTVKVQGRKLSKETIGNIINILCKQGLAERPENPDGSMSERKGVAATQKGIDYLAEITP